MLVPFEFNRKRVGVPGTVWAVLILTVALPAFAQEPAEDGQWPMAAKNYANTRYSGLGEITTQNVKNLKVAWTFSTGVNRGHEAAPIVVGQTMYVVTPYPNILYALDLANSGAMKWKYYAGSGLHPRLFAGCQPERLTPEACGFNPDPV
jgi:glucose dehydrogenase